MEFIAADLRENIHHWPTRRRFPHAAHNREVDFLRRADIRHVRRDAQPLKAHAQTFDMNLPFISPTPVRLKNAEDRALDAPTSFPCTLSAGTRVVRLKYCRPVGMELMT